MNNKRMPWIDMAKGFAALLVVVGHIRGNYISDGMSSIISTLHNPTFYMASGFLFMHKYLTPTVSVGKLLKKYIFKLMYPFVIWTIVYGIILVISGKCSIKEGIMNSANKLWFFPILFVGIILLAIMKETKMNSFIMYFFGIISISILIGSFYSSAVVKIIAYPIMVAWGEKHIFEKYKKKNVYTCNNNMDCFGVFKYGWYY